MRGTIDAIARGLIMWSVSVFIHLQPNSCGRIALRHFRTHSLIVLLHVPAESSNCQSVIASCNILQNFNWVWCKKRRRLTWQLNFLIACTLFCVWCCARKVIPHAATRLFNLRERMHRVRAVCSACKITPRLLLSCFPNAFPCN